MRDAMNKLGSDSNKINPLVCIYFFKTFVLCVHGKMCFASVVLSVITLIQFTALTNGFTSYVDSQDERNMTRCFMVIFNYYLEL